MGKETKKPALNLAEAVREGKYKWELSEDGTYCTLSGAVYCEKPENVFHNDEGGLYQSMIICAPTVYLNPDGTVNPDGKVNGYTAKTAPIIFKNNCQGWNSSVPTFKGDDCITTFREYVAEGFIYIGCGARSRNLTEGKAPAPIVDLKAGIRYLRLNDDAIPGDCGRIISVGGSGAGQMSSVIGATGNMEMYYPYLYEIGAAGIEKDGENYVSTIRDDVYGCMAFYPIADIENADMAYAWLRFDTGENGTRKLIPKEHRSEAVKFSEFQFALQDDLAVSYCEYLNGLGLTDENGTKMCFDTDADGRLCPRSGSYYDRTLKNISDALNKYLAQQDNGDEYIIESYGADTGNGNKVLPNWLKKNDDGGYSITDLKDFLNGTKLARNKDITSFDAIDKSGENNAFGRRDECAAHFSRSVAKILEENYERYSALEGFNKEYVDDYIKTAYRPDIVKQTELMNATHILLDCAAGRRRADIAPMWRIRVGTADQHASFSVGYNMALAAMKNSGVSVDYSLVWKMVHGREMEGTSAGTFIDWVHNICGGMTV